MDRKKHAKLAGKSVGKLSKFAQQREYDSTMMSHRERIIQMDPSMMMDNLSLQQVKKLAPIIGEKAGDKNESAELAQAWPGWKMYGGTGADPLMTKASGEMIVDEALGERPITQERFVSVMSTIPGLKLRCEVQETLLDCQEKVDSLRDRVSKLQICLQRLIQCDKLVLVLRIALACGNFLNAAKCPIRRVYPDPREALQLKGLKMFGEFKTNDRRKFLTEFIVDFFREMQPTELRFYAELLPCIKTAMSINPIQLDSDVAALLAGINQAKASLAKIERCTEVPGINDEFHHTVEDEIAALKVDEFEKQRIAMFDQFEECANFYGVDAFEFSFTESPMQLLFANVLSVLEGDGMYIQALERIEMKEKMEERKRLRKEAEEAKKNAPVAFSARKKGARKGQTRVALPSAAEFKNEFEDMLKAKGRRNMGVNKHNTEE